MRSTDEKTLLNGGTNVYDYLEVSSGAVVSHIHTVTASTVYSRRRTYSGTVTSNFKLLARERKALPLNPYTMLVTLAQATPYRRIESWWHWSANPAFCSTGYRLTTHSSCFGHVSYVPDAAHIVDASTKATNKAAKEASGLVVNLAEAFAERRQTAKLMADSVWRIARAARALRALNFKEVYHQLGTSRELSKSHMTRIRNTPRSQRISSHWLELQYGWRPLLQDVYGSAELLARHIGLDPYHTEVKSRATAQLVTHDFSKEDPSNSVGREIHKTSAKVVVRCSLDNECRQILSQTGIDNPLLLAWELLPYSFVVDWFVPVGSYLQSLNNFDGWIFQSGYVDQKTSMQYTRSWVKITNPTTTSKTDQTTVSVSGDAQVSSFKFTRSLLTGFPQARFEQMKTIDKSLSLEHCLNGLALLSSLFGKAPSTRL